MKESSPKSAYPTNFLYYIFISTLTIVTAAVITNVWRSHRRQESKVSYTYKNHQSTKRGALVRH
jgi:hypothetical protein